MSLLHNTFFSKQLLLYRMSSLSLAFIVRLKARAGYLLAMLLGLLVFSTATSAQTTVVTERGMWFDIHLVAAVLTTGVFLVALILAIVVYAQARHLRNANELIHEDKDSWAARLPPMLTMERLLVRVLILGFILLSGLILTGMFFGEAVWGAPLKWNHKTLFTLLSWVVIAVLLLGRQLRGWRGLMLVRSTIIGFVLLFLAYAGTHFVMDVLLHRSQ